MLQIDFALQNAILTTILPSDFAKEPFNAFKE
ncbi:MAG: hypothetical protein JWQ54_1502 [Mucilaginibacter sp.]|nr:hypothetical protein [Mucilaginibacter sp.]